MSGQPWTDPEMEQLRAIFPFRPTLVVAKMLGRSAASVNYAAAKHQMRKDAAYLASPECRRLRKGETRPGSVATQFPKGHVPANKGLRRPGWAPGRMRETQFRRGERTGMAARNWRPIGTVLTDTEGYQRIKVREAVAGEAYGFGNVRVWPLLQRHVWEQQHGPIPPGHAIAFRDENRQNCAIENLELVSRAELMRRNSIWRRLPRELIQVIQLNGALKRKLRRHGAKE